MKVVLTFTATNESHRIFNPFFAGLLDESGDFLVRDSTGKLVKRLREYHEGSVRSPVPEDYINLNARSSLSGKMQINPSRASANQEPLRPGRYTIQLVMHDRFLDLDSNGIVRKVRVASKQIPFRIVGQ